jgi:RNA ligase (TIGR02306 family)
MSEHLIEVVEVNPEKHPNADKLSVVKVHGWTVCINTAQWEGIRKGIYVPPDYVVPTDRPEFAWLKKEGATKHRVRVQKLRGVVSQGFLVPAPSDAVLGDNWMERLGIERWEPVVHGSSTRGTPVAGPNFYVPVYDVENLYARDRLMVDGEEVVVTEKLHGCNGRFVFADGKMWCGSRTEWKKEDEGNLWWKVLADNPWIREVCEANPEHIVYGEVIGVQGGFGYGCPSDKKLFRAFDVLYKGDFLPFEEAVLLTTLTSDCQTTDPSRWVPVLFRGPYNLDNIKALAEGQSTVEGANHIREGVVIQTIPDRIHPKYGRIKLKIVGNGYLEKS